MDKESGFLIARTLEKARQAELKSMPAHTAFLDMREQAVLEAALRREGIRLAPAAALSESSASLGSFCALFWGGYDDAERACIFFLPEWSAPSELTSELCVLRTELPKGARALSHRDYLGALLALGIERSVSGDILVRSEGEAPGADIIILRHMAEFLSENLTQVGRENTSNRILPIGDLSIGAPKLEEHTDTIASLRLDNVAASLFRLSRGKASEAIRAGLVYVDNRPCDKADKPISEGSIITLRGRGKAVLLEVGGRSRKDRVFIRYAVYK